ncbi:hypothetical protein LEP48_01405 [Isoptericola sp. NEAU-Y5]|uniref:Uncharacterized protein n=1 Tax=Isoptericola luteus TaxID=2879484 RepID=A0ABS7ZAC4_9MICO|nr:hypothetical protein [Isoptericola sp. NEAU-Y5]MCA5892007.1 hypothetical protein [Isoptericola sp. NEAU-Y5]
MSPVQTLVPAEHASDHVLVVPAAALTVPDLAPAWFDDVDWLVPPRTTREPKAVGARFRGMRTAEVVAAEPGVLRLGEVHRAVGPFPVAAEAAEAVGVVGAAEAVGVVGAAGPAEAWALGRADGLPDVRGVRPTSYDDRDGIRRVFASGLPEGPELHLVRWGVAVARRAGGVLLADGAQALRPDPEGGVDLVLHADRALDPAELLAAVRSVVANAQPADRTPGASYGVVASTSYDGSLLADVVPGAPAPGATATVGGGVAHRLRWLPPDPFELEVEHPSGLHLIARSRVRALLARLAIVLAQRAGGEVVDDGGFALRNPDLERRTAAGASGVRAWRS